MRVVTSRSREWLSPGIGSTEVDVLLGCNVERKRTPLVLWSEKIEQRRIHAEGRPVKIVSEAELPQGSPAWLQWRNGGVGGSEISVLTGDSKFKTPADLYKVKVGESTDTSENADMARGKALEPRARELYEGLMGWNSPPLCVLHDEYDYMRCSLDGLRSDQKVVLEIKAPKARGHQKNWECYSPDPDETTFNFANKVPYYYAQVQYQMLLTGADLCHFVSYCEDSTFDSAHRLCLLEIKADHAKQERITKLVRKFWDYVLRRVPPMNWDPHAI